VAEKVNAGLQKVMSRIGVSSRTLHSYRVVDYLFFVITVSRIIIIIPVYVDGLYGWILQSSV